MSRIDPYQLTFCFCMACLALPGLKANADPIRMTLTGNAGGGGVNISWDLPSGTLGNGGSFGQWMLGSLNPFLPTGTYSSGVTLSIALNKLSASGSPDPQGATIAISGMIESFYSH